MSSPDSMHNARVIFALICCLGLIAVATGTVLEIKRARRGDSILPARQFRLRLISALIWAITLGSLAYAVIFLWSERGDWEQARRFLAVISGAMMLIVIGLFLLAYDIWLVGQARRLQQAHLERNKSELARAELERVRQEHHSGNAPSPAPPVDGSAS